MLHFPFFSAFYSVLPWNIKNLPEVLLSPSQQRRCWARANHTLFSTPASRSDVCGAGLEGFARIATGCSAHHSTQCSAQCFCCLFLSPALAILFGLLDTELKAMLFLCNTFCLSGVITYWCLRAWLGRISICCGLYSQLSPSKYMPE